MEIKFDNEKDYDDFIKWMNDKTPNEFVKKRLVRHRDMKEVQEAKKILKERENMSKVQLPPKTADKLIKVIESYELEGKEREDILSDFCQGYIYDRLPSEEISIQTLSLALFVGFEVKETPSQVIKRRFAQLNDELTSAQRVDDLYSMGFVQGEKSGIRYALNEFDIVIAGVNQPKGM